MYIFKELNVELEKTLFQLCSKMIKEKEHYTEGVYKDIAKFILPERSTLFDGEQSGQAFGEDTFSGYPGYCHRKMTNSLYGNLCPRNTNWMELAVNSEEKPSNLIQQQLNDVNKRMMELLDNSNFYGNQTQFISDGVGFGNGVQYIKDDVLDGKTKFLGIHPAQYYLDTDDDGDVKSILRKMKMPLIDVIRVIRGSSMQGSEGKGAYKKYLPDEYTAGTAADNMLQDVDVCHMTMKNKYYKDLVTLPGEYVGTAKFSSVWFISKTGEGGEVIAVDRHVYFPYVTWMYNLETGWSYGFGPGHYALPDAKVLQQHTRARLEAGQRAAAPPLQIPEELKNKVNNRPYGKTYYEDASRLVQGLYQQTNFPISTEVTNEIKEVIGFHYMLDVWQTLSDITARMTAYEVSERIGEKMSMISSVVGNFLVQGLTQQIRLFMIIEETAGRLTFPEGLKKYIKKKGIKIEYKSLLAQSVKKHLENQGLMRTIGEMQLIFELNEDLRFAFDWHKVAERMIAGSTSAPDILISEAKYNKKLEDMAKEKKMLAQSEAAKNVGAGNDGSKGMVR